MKKFNRRKWFLKALKNCEDPISLSSWEHNYKVGYLFKRNFKNVSHVKKIIELKRLADIKILNSTPYEIRRAKSHRKYSNCFCCNKFSYLQHHIILVKNGGYDMGINRIPICEKCHNEIHPWMKLKSLEEQFDLEMEDRFILENS